MRHQVEVVVLRLLRRPLIHNVEFAATPVNDADIGSSGSGDDESYVNALAIVIQRDANLASRKQPNTQPLDAASVEHHKLWLTFVNEELAPDFAFAVYEPQLLSLDYTIVACTH